jgi:hypothetical protein
VRSILACLVIVSEDVGKSADAGACPAGPVDPTGPARPSGPKCPRRKSTRWSHWLSLVLGSGRGEAGLFEIGCGEFARLRRGHETRATLADRDNSFAAALRATPGVLCRRQARRAQWARMRCADPSVRVGSGLLSDLRAKKVGQGNRVKKSTPNETCQVVVVPRSDKSAGFHRILFAGRF